MPGDGALTAPLRHRDFRLLTTGRTFAEFGNAVAPVALAFAVLDLTGSAVQLGLVVGARSLANVVLVLFGGVLADRLPRSVILQGTETAAAVTQAAIAVSVLGGFASVPLLIGLSVANGAVSAVALPASSSILPQTVPSALLTQANALGRMLANMGRFGGAAAGGVLAAALGSGWAIAANAVLFLVAAVAYRGLRLARFERTGPARPLADLAEGWREFRSRAWVWIVVLQFMIVNAVAAGGLLVLGPAIADDTFGRAGWGFVLAAQTAGFVLGGLVVAHWRPRRLLAIGVAAVLVDALPLTMLARAPGLMTMIAAMVVAGAAIELFAVAWDVSLQENVPQDRLARVYAYDVLGSIIAMPVGEVIAGPLAEHFGRERTLLWGAVLVVVATLLALCSKQVRGLRRLTPAPTPVS
ncbi:Predicted arabinose efflux permease, MFS family [Amycolatopsis xylanica]|uniref:Predicted arabinose efflux permease, MFS family n=1 Tax=Amycolatopsis xylanica TaxID=589385 RepID=A0A1H3DYF4_9PSEU|nr:MFS transporter [Amycolatopsis xylanica]SDX71475.1 Predicted arabinose efflux permease, MFS family [Amycolatopsis xylanica]